MISLFAFLLVDRSLFVAGMGLFWLLPSGWHFHVFASDDGHLINSPPSPRLDSNAVSFLLTFSRLL